MKYTLVLGIAYKKYMNFGDIAVYVGGRLIDAFQIEQDVTFVCEDTVTSLLDETWYRRLGKTRWLTRLGTNKDHVDYGEGFPTHELVPKLFKIYEIEEQDLNGLVEIKVDNSHNDHNNGFMKNNSMIRFPMIGLFPSHFVENKGEQLMRIVKRFGERFDDSETKHGPRARRENSCDPRLYRSWPCVYDFYVRRQSETFEKNGLRNGHWWIGGNFTAEIPIKTKHRIKYLCSMGAKGTGFFVKTPYALILATCKPLLNIYNEDQRSNRTKD
jgi:hypothetical protein